MCQLMDEAFYNYLISNIMWLYGINYYGITINKN